MGKQSESELQAEIAELEAKGFRVVVIRWLTEAEEMRNSERLGARWKEANE